MDLSKLNRRKYTDYKTPIEYLANISKNSATNVYIKRDDLLGLAAGGNKTRKLEFLLADAINKNCDTIITCGAVQSNHCRLTLAAAKKENMACHLVLEERVPNSYNPKANGNNFLFHLLGVDGISVVEKGANMADEMQKVADALVEKGKKPYIIPGGGSNEIGSLGYVACAQELYQQMYDSKLRFDAIYLASGSGGTHSGLLVGLRDIGVETPIFGISVNRNEAEQKKVISNLCEKIISFHKVPVKLSPEDIIIDDKFVGRGYSYPTEGMVEAVQTLAREEAILLDPTYSGKAMAGMLQHIRSNKYTKEENILFLHTGGAPALYSIPEVIINGVD